MSDCTTRLQNRSLILSYVQEPNKISAYANIPFKRCCQDSINRLTDTRHHWQYLISKFNDTQFNLQPFEGSWTGSQVVDHIRKSVKGIPSEFFGQYKCGE